MPLEGNVKEFGLADVLQFIASNQKAGVLQLTSRNDKASIAFDNGQVNGAVYGRQGRQDQLSNYLLRSKKVDSEKLGSILKIQNDTGIPLGELLLKEGLMTQEELNSMVVFKIQEVLDEVFTWSDARYKFNPEERLYQNSRSQVSIPAESLLLETLRRKDEWPAIARALPSDGIIVKKKADIITGLEETPDILQIFDLVDGERTIGQIIEQTYLGRFRTFNAIYNLLISENIEVIHAPEPETKTVEKRPEKPSGILAGAMATVCVLLGIAALCGAVFGAYRIRLITVSSTSDLVLLENKKALEYRLRHRIELYRMTNGHYPAGLETLGLEKTATEAFVYNLVEGDPGYILKDK
jgi:hypothetical protein